ncbi:hypothetical protein FACS189449_01180 [Alphaproteobacteria bacterium]|nr:hypothetical protein FACS189449_01180 [Alphaproteobacteria bacterium]
MRINKSIVISASVMLVASFGTAEGMHEEKEDSAHRVLSEHATLDIDGNKYVGQHINRVPCGKGTMTYANGKIYVGDWVDGKREGKGRYTFPWGAEYEGEWRDDKGNGKGIYKSVGGDIYEGDWENGGANGKGTMKYNNEDFYDGNWINGKRTGEGTYVWFSPRHVYTGHWRDNKMHGKGKLTYDNGDVYEGFWVDNEIDERGKITHPDEFSYVKNCCEDKSEREETLQLFKGIIYPMVEKAWIVDLLHMPFVDPDNQRLQEAYATDLVIITQLPINMF